ncbi:unnamed protein product, partial [Trichobilharzia regenti]
MIHPSLGGYNINSNPGSNSLSSSNSSSSASSSSASSSSATTTTTSSTTATTTPTSIVTKTTTNSLNSSPGKQISDNNTNGDEEEEGEMDQELVDIMVGLNGVGGGIGGESKFPFSSSHTNNLSIGGGQHRHHSLLTNNHHPHPLLGGNDIGASPDGRRVIAAMVAALANVSNSPLLDG